MTSLVLSIIGGLTGAAGWLYGMWQRSRADHFAKEAEFYSQMVADHDTVAEDEKARLEAVITDLKSRLVKAEEAALAHLTPDELRARLGELLTSFTST